MMAGSSGNPRGDHSAAGHTPPSAAGYLEPYGIRVTLHLASHVAPGEAAEQPAGRPVAPAAAEFEPQAALVALLQSVAEACVASGGVVIGHLKCQLHLPDMAVACNLTSLRQGAQCIVRPASDGASHLRGGSGPGGVSAPCGTSGPNSQPAALGPGQEARLDLAVLVYGLSTTTIDALVRAALSQTFGPLGLSWSTPA